MINSFYACCGLLLLGCGQGGDGATSTASGAASGASASPSGPGPVQRCVTPAGLCYEYTGKKFRDDQAASKKSCDTAAGGKLEVGTCPKEGMLGACTRNIGQPAEYLMLVPAPATNELSRANFEAQQHCQTGGDEIGVCEGFPTPAPQGSSSAGPRSQASGAK